MNNKIIRIINMIFRIGYHLCIISAVIILIIGLLVPFSNEKNLGKYSYLPIEFSIINLDAKVSILDSQENISMVSGSGSLILVNGSKPVAYYYFTTSFITIIFAIYLFHLLTGITNSLKEGNIFTDMNFKRIRNIGITFLLFYLVDGIIRSATTIYISENLKSPDMVGISLIPGAFDFTKLISPLLILVFAEIFRKALFIKQENELTI